MSSCLLEVLKDIYTHPVRLKNSGKEGTQIVMELLCTCTQVTILPRLMGQGDTRI